MSYTTNPRTPQPGPETAPREATGPVASDSLAAESLDAEGAFSANPSAAAMGVRGAQSTLANTDISGASVLRAAPSGADREKMDALGARPDERGPSGLKLDTPGKPVFDGTHSEEGYHGGSRDTNGLLSQGSTRVGDSDFGASTVSSRDTVHSHFRSTGPGFESTSSSISSFPAECTDVHPHVPQAPGYTANVTGAAMPEGTYKPKGSNLDDADLTESMPKTKTFTGNVGGVNDPGRPAEREFDSRNADVATEIAQAGVRGGRVRQNGQGAGEEGGIYGVMSSERA
ncbi:uncharacterized protein Z518_07601 [Rhinocladiella mackenziei CBS 650.93]|uniref:Uncharacterized protein n=1 Tax=Rhinocladiella mackenziei CBS 650.93 TaxID=1442369 RepID=A0A0D2H0U5_9EURO|nr:uncharacterized protein Z518_07601 [Rhinocladiella mackenziei CBS 650.93]KIX04048.1 hypothetical protein Z518_07601 [Rhinocladiella mackenziei CBS 650.93]